MKYLSITLCTLITLVACNSEKETGIKERPNRMEPTVAKKPKELTIHGDTRIDNYYWLNERENPEVIAYLDKENAFLEKKTAHTKPLQNKLFDEIVGRIKKTDMSVPYIDNGYSYYVRHEEGKEYPIHCRRIEDVEAKEEIILDANEQAIGHEYYNASGLSVSPNNKMLAFGEDTVSRRKYNLRFKNLQTGEYYEDVILNTTGGTTWASDNKTVFYTRKDEVTLRSDKIYKHVMGTDPDEDLEVFYEKDETFGTYIYKTKSDKYLVIGSYSTLESEVRILEADNPNGEFRVIKPRGNDIEYSITHFQDFFYIKTNYEAKNFRLMKVEIENPAIENWKEVIPHRDDVLLEGVDIFKDYMVLEERKNGLTNIRIINMNDKTEHYLEFDEETYVSYVSWNPEFNTNIVRFGYMSMTTPNSTYDYNMSTREKTLLKQQEVVGDFDPNDYKSERQWATAKDGTKIPISIVYKKGIKKDGSNPTLLYGYGSYGSTMDPYFSSVRLSLLDRGFVYAIAHIRGGEEMGRYWYEEGKMLNKMNTFTDFIACGDHLIAENYTSNKKLCAMGGSAGGLLVGAVINLRPKMWKAVIAAVPFVDVVTTMLDETIPLTTGEFDEWGNPKDKEYYDYMKSYSPYDNVEAKDYPAMLVTTGLHDSQVQYWEPAKWVAKLREMRTDTNNLLLYCNMETGHGGASGRFKRHRESAMEYAFLLDQLGITE